MRDLYAVLGCRPRDSAEEVRRQYRRRALACHPDKAGQQDGEAHRHFLELKEAYEVLSDPSARAAYDEERRLNEALSQPVRFPEADEGWGQPLSETALPPLSELLRDCEDLKPVESDQRLRREVESRRRKMQRMWDDMFADRRHVPPPSPPPLPPRLQRLSGHAAGSGSGSVRSPWSAGDLSGFGDYARPFRGPAAHAAPSCRAKGPPSRSSTGSGCCREANQSPRTPDSLREARGATPHRGPASRQTSRQSSRGTAVPPLSPMDRRLMELLSQADPLRTPLPDLPAALRKKSHQGSWLTAEC
eukprot:EG_transcript_14510